MQLRLYKYLSLAALSSFVKNHTIKLSFGYEANDRFELLPGDVLPSDDWAKRETEAAHVVRHGFISLTKVEDNPYMWGSYADKHRGACLEFLFEVEVEDNGRFRRLDKENPLDKSLGGIEHSYFEGAYIEACEYAVNRSDRVVKDFQKCTQNLISNKHLTWAQEKEYRIVYSTARSSGRPNEELISAQSHNGIIYLTKDINRCAVALRISPLCPMDIQGVRLGLAQCSDLRGLRVERAIFGKCTYLTTFSTLKDDMFEGALDYSVVQLLKQKGIAPCAYLRWNSFIASCKYGDVDILEKVYVAFYADDKLSQMLQQKDIDGYNGSAIAILRHSRQCVEYLLDKGMEPEGLTENELKAAIYWCVSIDFARCLEVLLRSVLLRSVLKKGDFADKDGRNLIAMAARNGSLSCMNSLLNELQRKQDGINWQDMINEQDGNGRTPLMLAAWAKDAGIVDILLTCNADVSLTDNDGATALIFAAARSRGNDSPDADAKSCLIVQNLLEHDANPSCKETRTGYTALMYAVSAGYTQTVETLIRHSAKVVDEQSENGLTPAMFAILYGKRVIARKLLENKNMLEEVDKVEDEITKNNILASYVLWIGKDERFFQDENIRKKIVKTIQGVCLSRGLSWIVRAVIEDMDDALKRISELFFREYSKESEPDEVVRRKVRACFCQEDKGGCTPLMWSVGYSASTCYALDFLLEFLDEDAMEQIERKDYAGCNVLMWAARKGNEKAIQHILDYINGRFPNKMNQYLAATDCSGMTAMMWAAWKGKLGALKTLVKYLEDDALSQSDVDGNSALDYACKAKHDDVAKFLINTGVRFGK